MTCLTIKALDTYTHVCITFSLPKIYANLCRSIRTKLNNRSRKEVCRIT